MSEKIGVYICHCGSNIAQTVDCKSVVEYATGLPKVAVARDYQYMCSDPGQELIKKDVKELGLTRVVVASCSPLMHEPTFRRAVEEAGLNQFMFQMANIREQCSWISENKEMATERAKAIVGAAVSRVLFQEPLAVKKVPVNPSVLIVGGGITGIEAALQIADSGKKVYLVEREPTIGGYMARFDKTFPTLDCAACILTPKMVSVGQHQNIELLSYSDVTAFSGYVGNFTARVRRRPKYVEDDKCNGCGLCTEKCPLSVPSEFECGLGKRKAIYRPFPQAVPNVPVIDTEHCLYFTKGICKVCQKFCPAEAINFEQKAEEIELDVASIIVATGFQLQDPRLIPQYGYATHENVHTSLEFERLVSSTGPTVGEIVRASDKKHPNSIAFIQCVCSRDMRMNPSCSAFCCMASVKQAILAKEHLPGVDCTVFYMDLRAFGKGYQEFYDRARIEFGVKFIRGRPAKIEEVPETKNLILTYEDTNEGRLNKMEVEMAVLAVGVKINPIESFIHVPLDEDGYVKLANPYLDPVSTEVNGIFAAGVVAGAKDIPDSVTQGSAAAMRASVLAVRE